MSRFLLTMVLICWTNAVFSQENTATSENSAASENSAGALKAAGKLEWADEFDGSEAELDKKWEFQNGPSSHILCSRWRKNAVLQDGMLRLVNRKESRVGQDWTSASAHTKDVFQYGYFECRYRYAAATGTNNSFWLMMLSAPDSSNPKAKKFEIDINEGHYPSEINTNVHNWSDVLHRPDGKTSHPTFSKSFPFPSEQDFAAEFHTYGLLWTKDELVFYFDDHEIRRIKNDFCHSPAPVFLSEAVIRWAGPVTDALDGTFMEVDYVRIYKISDSKPSP